MKRNHPVVTRMYSEIAPVVFEAPENGNRIYAKYDGYLYNGKAVAVMECNPEQVRVWYMTTDGDRTVVVGNFPAAMHYVEDHLYEMLDGIVDAEDRMNDR